MIIFEARDRGGVHRAAETRGRLRSATCTRIRATAGALASQHDLHQRNDGRRIRKGTNSMGSGYLPGTLHEMNSRPLLRCPIYRGANGHIAIKCARPAEATQSPVGSTTAGSR